MAKRGPKKPHPEVARARVSGLLMPSDLEGVPPTIVEAILGVDWSRTEPDQFVQMVQRVMPEILPEQRHDVLDELLVMAADDGLVLAPEIVEVLHDQCDRGMAGWSVQA